MPRPEETCQVIVGGTVYDQWEWFEFERKVGVITSHLRVRAMEITPPDLPRKWSNLRLKPDDSPVTVNLAGRTVMSDGFVSIRQVAFDANTHQIEIVVASKTNALSVSTPIDAVGQYKNATFLQLANKIAAPYGIRVVLQGPTQGAEKPFERVSIHWGETAKQAIERLARMRDLHLVDGVDGTLVAVRADVTAAAAPDLVEGGNIQALHGIMSIEEALADVWGHGQNIGNDQHYADDARDLAAVAKSSWAKHRPGLILAEMPVDVEGLKMRVAAEVDANALTVLEVYVTVPGLLAGNTGMVWSDFVLRPVTIYSPMMFPTDASVLTIRGVKHRQSNEEGTTTIIECCLPRGIGGNAWGGVGVLPGNQPPQEQAPDG